MWLVAPPLTLQYDVVEEQSHIRPAPWYHFPLHRGFNHLRSTLDSLWLGFIVCQSSNNFVLTHGKKVTCIFKPTIKNFFLFFFNMCAKLMLDWWWTLPGPPGFRAHKRRAQVVCTEQRLDTSALKNDKCAPKKCKSLFNVDVSVPWFVHTTYTHLLCTQNPGSIQQTCFLLFTIRHSFN